jgi:uncharacterized protein (UPF0261 family)
MQPDNKVVAIVATLDTKSAEVAYVADGIRARGRTPHIIDIGVLGRSPLPADSHREDIASLGGASLDSLAKGNNPGVAMAAMGRGAQRKLAELLAQGRLDAVVGIAGGKGTALFADTVETLPFTLTKVVVSSARAAVIGDLAGRTNTVVIPTLVDLMGINDFSRQALEHAVVLAAAARYSPEAPRTAQTVGITAFGVTTPAAMRCVEQLERRGYESLVFPANGAGGRLLERFIAEGMIDAVIDLTTTEIADEVVGGRASAGEDRLLAAGRRGIPAWISAGAVDMVNFGPRETVPERFAGRTFFQHSSQTTLMRTTAEENYAIGLLTADRVSQGTGPRTIVWPSRGVSDYDRDGGPFQNPEADRRWWDGIRDAVAPDVPTLEQDLHINDPAFADSAVEWIDQQLKSQKVRSTEYVQQN